MKRVQSKVAAVLVSCLLVVSLAGGGLLFGGNGPAEAEIESDATPLAEANNGPALSIIAGAATPVPGKPNTYSFPNLEVTAADASRPIMSITVQFTSAITDADEIYFTNDEGFTVFDATKHGNKSVNSDKGATATQWRDYLRDNLEIQLADTVTVKSLRMIASFEKVDRTLDYNSLNGHYYEVGKTASGAVDVGKSWTYALKQAETKTYMGMKGYLVTVTSREEQDFVFSLVHTDTWIGGTCDDTYTRASNAWAQNYRISAADNSNRWSSVQTYNGGGYSHYYWVSGPEAGKKMGECRYGGANERRTVVDPDTGKDMFMFWASAQPDGYTTGEKWMQLAVQYGTSQKEGQWNDLPEDYGNMRYIIEYGGMPDDEDLDDPTSSGDANVDVHVQVKVEIKIDPKGETLTTEAANTTVGTPPVIRESVNGDPNVKTDVNGTKQDAEIERTFYVKDPEAEGGWRKMDESELVNGYPVHVGDYKVVSSAVHSVKDGEENEYDPGEAKFSIKPAQVDALDHLIDSGDPGTTNPDGAKPGEGAGNGSGGTGSEGTGGDTPGSGDSDGSGSGSDSGEGDGSGSGTGSGAEGALSAYGKVYDGTPAFDTSRLSLGGFALAGADVRFACDDEASYDSAQVGTERVITLSGVHLAGAHAGDYSLKGIADDGTLTLKGRIIPRELEVTAKSSVVIGLAGQPLRDAAGDKAVLSSNEDVHDDPSAAWLANMLAPVDAERTEAGLSSILGEAVLTCTNDTTGEPLDVNNPKVGLYTVQVHFENVNPLPATASVDDEPSAGVMALADFAAPSVTELGANRYDLGNYLLTINGGKVLVTDNLKDESLDEIGEVVVDDRITREPDPKAPVMLPEDAGKLIAETYPDKVPAGVEPNVVITKNGQPVPSIDLGAVGEYVIVATYPDPNGVPDKIARVVYSIEEKPVTPPSDDDNNDDGSNDDASGKEEGAGNGNGNGANGSNGGTSGSGASDKATWDKNVIIDEKVTIDLDRNGKPMSRDDIAKDLEDRYGKRADFPKDIVPAITITKDGKQVDSIDRTKPGTYVVEALYTYPDGTTKTIRVTYVVQDPDSLAAKIGTRLAQTGDTAAASSTALLAVGALVICVIAAARRRKAGE